MVVTLKSPIEEAKISTKCATVSMAPLDRYHVHLDFTRLFQFSEPVAPRRRQMDPSRGGPGSCRYINEELLAIVFSHVDGVVESFVVRDATDSFLKAKRHSVSC